MPPPNGCGSLLDRLDQVAHGLRHQLAARVSVGRVAAAPGRYQSYLRRLYGFYLPVEVLLDQLGAADIPGLDWPARQKSGLLSADLVLLGDDPATLARLPLCDALPAVAPGAGVLGALYVLDGDAVVSPALAQQLRPHLVGPARQACGFLEGRAAVAAWRQLQGLVLAHCGDEDGIELALDAARQTAARLLGWLDAWATPAP